MDEVNDWFSPDGLTSEDIAWLFRDRLSDDTPRPTAALLDGSALARRQRREAQRLLGGTVRVLRVHGHLSTAPTGTEAA